MTGPAPRSTGPRPSSPSGVPAVLAKLATSGRRLVVPQLATGELDRHPVDVTRAHVVPLDTGRGGALGLDAFDEAIDALVAKTTRFDAAAIDSAAAVAVHRCLSMPRRIAADPAIWRWLAVVHRPDFVRHRWEARTWSTMRDRFWKPGTRPDSNVFARLWWIAELSRTGDDYGATERLLRSQSLANAVFVRRLSDHAPFVHACARVLTDQPSFVIERVLARFNMMASTVPVEGRGEEQLVDALERLLEDVGIAWST